MKLLKELGYESTQRLCVCLRESHFWKWDVHAMSGTTVCYHCKERGDIPYYYLSLSNKVFVCVTIIYVGII